jgi:hypothetical protein
MDKVLAYLSAVSDWKPQTPNEKLVCVLCATSRKYVGDQSAMIAHVMAAHSKHPIANLGPEV